VTEATDAYLESQDVLGDWLDECCEENVNYRETSSALFGSWKEWCEKRNQYIGPRNDFTTKLESRGFASRRTGREGRRIHGLKLKPYTGDAW
jgi:putative DNA primase/helicase